MADLDKVTERFARGSFHLFIGNLISEIANAVGIIIVARLLTPEDMGIYGLSFVLAGFFWIFSDLGISQALIRFLARYQNLGQWGKVKNITQKAFMFQAGLTCLLAVIMYLSATPLATLILKRAELAGIIRITSSLVITQSLYTTANAVFTGLERMDLNGAMKVLLSVVKATSAIILVNQGYGVHSLIYGHLIGTGAASIISIIIIYILLSRMKTDQEHPASVASLPVMLRFGFPLFLSTFLMRFEQGYRGLLLAWFSSNAAIGNLDIANKFLSLAGLFTLPIATVLYPAFSKLDIRKQPAQMKILYRSSVRYATLIIIPITTAMVLFSRQGIGLLFGSRYELAPTFFSLSLLQYLAVGLGSLSVFGFLNSQGDTTTSFRLNAIKVVLNLLLSTILIRLWGIPGLLTALFISAVAGNALNHYITQRKYGIEIDLRFTLRVVMFSAIAAILTWQTLQITPFLGSLLQIILGGAFFVSACLILAPISHAIGINDVQTLRRVLSKVPILHLIAEPFLTVEEKIIRFLNH